MLRRFLHFGVFLLCTFSVLGHSKTRVKHDEFKNQLLATSWFSGKSPKIGEVQIRKNKSQFQDFFSQLELARFIYSVMRPNEMADEVGASIYPFGDFDQEALERIVNKGEYKLVFAAMRSGSGNYSQVVRLVSDDSFEASFVLDAKLVGKRLIQVRPDPSSRVLRVFYADVEGSFTIEESKAAKLSLGLSRFFDTGTVMSLVDLSYHYEANQTYRARLGVLSKVTMASLSVFFGYLAYKAVLRSPAGGHGCGSGCGHHHHHGPANLAKRWHKPFKVFDTVVFSLGSFAWGSHALELHDRAEKLEESAAKQTIERLLHAIEIGALTLGLTKGGLALTHILLPESIRIPATAKSFLAASAVSGHDMQQIIFVSTFLMCPFDEILGSIPLAWLGGALDMHRAKQVWSHHSDFSILPAIVHTHGFIPWLAIKDLD